MFSKSVAGSWFTTLWMITLVTHRIIIISQPNPLFCKLHQVRTRNKMFLDISSSIFALYFLCKNKTIKLIIINLIFVHLSESLAAFLRDPCHFLHQPNVLCTKDMSGCAFSKLQDTKSGNTFCKLNIPPNFMSSYPFQ